MDNKQLATAEALRFPKTMLDPDPRSSTTSVTPQVALLAHHASIAEIQIGNGVPESVAIHFETARNLYLYAWHVYRFYPVAAAHSLATLEMGLRTRLPAVLPAPYQKPWQKKPMLAGLLGYAIDQGLVINAGFRRWHAAAEGHARERRSWESVRQMIALELEVMHVDESAPLEITEEDRRWNLVQVLRETLPNRRNELAHGSTYLTDQVLGTLELVAEILEQLYPMHPL